MLEVMDHGDVREIRIDRPPANALNPELVEKLTQSLTEAGESASAVVISGRPGMFSAGLDVPELLEFEDDALVVRNPTDLLEAEYVNVIENAFDESHLYFLHQGTIGVGAIVETT